MLLVDTSVLVYAVGIDHALCSPARRFVQDVQSGATDGQTTPAVLQEFAHVRGRRRSREDAARLADRYAAMLSPLVTVTARDVAEGLDIWAGVPDIGAFDAVLSAVALAHGARLLSADRGFSRVPGLEWIDLADY